MIPIADARAFVLDGLEPLEAVTVDLGDAVGCVAATQVSASEPVPSFVNSSMDGYALRAADAASGETSLNVVGAILAGDAPTRVLGEGEAMRIMTGAPLPPGADAVCPIEVVTVEGGVVRVTGPVAAGAYVRYPGDDTKVGDVLVRAGDVLGPARLGVLAGQGLSSALVHPRPRVGVISTGDELSDDPGPLAPGRIRDANRPALLASLRQAGCDPVDLGRSSDDEHEIARRLREAAASCDAVISTGGVSVGDVDFVKTVLSTICGDRARWMQVAVRPGKPFAFGRAGESGTPIFGLPGNPVSTLVSFELFVRPALRRLAGHRELGRPSMLAVLDCDLARRPDGRDYMVHVTVVSGEDGRVHVTSATRQGSHLLAAVAGANALAHLPDGDGLSAGDDVRVMILDPDRLAAVAMTP